MESVREILSEIQEAYQKTLPTSDPNMAPSASRAWKATFVQATTLAELAMNGLDSFTLLLASNPYAWAFFIDWLNLVIPGLTELTKGAPSVESDGESQFTFRFKNLSFTRLKLAKLLLNLNLDDVHRLAREGSAKFEFLLQQLELAALDVRIPDSNAFLSDQLNSRGTIRGMFDQLTQDMDTRAPVDLSLESGMRALSLEPPFQSSSEPDRHPDEISDVASAPAGDDTSISPDVQIASLSQEDFPSLPLCTRHSTPVPSSLSQSGF